MIKFGIGIVAAVYFALGLSAAVAIFCGAGCTPHQQRIAGDAADVAHATCVLLLDLGAPDVVREVCDVEEDVYPLVDAALATATRAAATEVACPAAPEAAPVLAIRRIDGRAQPPILLRDRAVLRLVVSR